MMAKSLARTRFDSSEMNGPSGTEIPQARNAIVAAIMGHHGQSFRSGREGCPRGMSLTCVDEQIEERRCDREERHRSRLQC